MLVKKRKSSPPLLVKILMVLLSIGALGLGIWWAMPRPEPVGFAEISSILPETTEVAFTIDLESWAFLDKLVSTPAKAIVKRAIERSPLQTLLGQRDGWSKGTIGVALLGNKTDETTATVVIAPSKSRRGGEDFLSRYRLGRNFREQTYGEFSYHQLEGSPDRNDVTAVVNNYVIIASHPQALFQIIDVWQNKQTSLQSLSVLQEKSQKPALIAGIVRANSQLFDQNQRALAALTFRLDPLSNGLGMGVGAHFSQNLPPIPDRPSTLVSLLPADTFLALSGWQLGESWSFLTKAFPDNETLRQFQTTIEDNSPFDLQQDILAWLTGEFTIGAIPAQEGIIGKTAGFGLVFIAEADREGSRSFFDQLDRLAVESEGGILPRGVTLQSQPDQTRWQVGTSIAASHGVINQAVYWAMGELGARLNTSPKLADSPQFQAIRTATNGGYFYLDMTVARTILKQRIAPEDWQKQTWFQDTMTILDTIEAIGFTQSRVNDRTSRLEGKFIFGTSS